MISKKKKKKEKTPITNIWNEGDDITVDSPGIKSIISAHCATFMPIQHLKEMEKFERQKLLKSLRHCRNVTDVLTNKPVGQEDFTVSSTKYLRKK